jgi:hypothetical protein
MLKTRIKLRNQGFYDVRRLPSVISMLEGSAERIADAANSMSGMDGYLTGSRQGAKKAAGPLACVDCHVHGGDDARQRETRHHHEIN